MANNDKLGGTVILAEMIKDYQAELKYAAIVLAILLLPTRSPLKFIYSSFADGNRPAAYYVPLSTQWHSGRNKMVDDFTTSVIHCYRR